MCADWGQPMCCADIQPIKVLIQQKEETTWLEEEILVFFCDNNQNQF